MPRPIVFPLIMLLLAACRSAPEPAEAPPENEPVKPALAAGVIENEDIPPWAAAWLEGGNRAVERLGSYQGRYVFVRTGTGDNFGALNQWAEGFSADKDFAPLAAERIERRMYYGTADNPDEYYGAFFSILMRRAFDKDYSGAVEEDTFWFALKDGGEGESWLFLILTTIDKASFQEQVRSMFGYMNLIPRPTSEQQKAINRVTEYFFTGF